MTSPAEQVGESLAAYLASGRVVRLGEASLLGYADLRPDPERLDLAHAGRLGPSEPLRLLVCHFPGEVDAAGLREELRRALPGIEVSGERALLPLYAVTVEPAASGWALDCRLSLPSHRLALVFLLVAALEEAVARQGAEPRRISRVVREETPRRAPAALFLPLLRPLLGWPFPRRWRAASGRAAGSAADGGAPVRSPEASRAVVHPTWRRLLRVPAQGSSRPAGPGRPGGMGRPEVDAGRRVVRTARPDGTAGSLDLPATIARAALRQTSSRLVIHPGDLCWAYPPEPPSADLCLLLDASASMAGERARACTRMAEFLLRNSHGRLALVAFRGGDGQLLVNFTRSRRKLREALLGLPRGGLTPLAAGLLLGLAVAGRAPAGRARVILVTDGEPTRALWSRNAAADALQAAGRFRRAGVPLTCVGLPGDEQFLEDLAHRSGGRCYVLRDWSAPALLTVSRRLLGRISSGHRGSRCGGEGAPACR